MVPNTTLHAPRTARRLACVAMPIYAHADSCCLCILSFAQVSKREEEKRGREERRGREEGDVIINAAILVR